MIKCNGYPIEMTSDYVYLQDIHVTVYKNEK